jgi:putative photosynthetic complex assembly protein 2
MTLHGYPALYLLAIWWFTTGLIIYLDGLPPRTFRWSFLGTTVLFGLALVGMALTRDDASVRGAYLAFTCGVLAWGWQEVSFYMGYVTGPRRRPCPEGCRGLPHFWHAIETSLYHELAIIASAAAVATVTRGGANQVAWWTFLVMWWMHQSAKLNVFLGVRNLNEEFLPEHLRFLRSFLTKRSMNLLFPVSVTVSTVVAAMLLDRASGPAVPPFEAVAFTFVGGLMVLAILEHWFLVLPLPAASLWSWGLRSRGKTRPVSVEVVTGFLGAGKTTFLRHRLGDADPERRTVVLVNDFAEVGIDGALLREQGREVVELANGCFCCSLRDDLVRQLRDVVTRLAPDQVLIEPSGLAETGALLATLRRPELADIIADVRVVTLVDAGAFLVDYARLASHFRAQMRAAPTILVNKADQVSSAELRTIEDTIRPLNPSASILRARYGIPVDGQPASAPPVSLEPHAHEDEADHEHGHANAPSALGVDSWSGSLEGSYDEQRLRDELTAMAEGRLGDILRVKGIVRVRRGWVHFDVAGGRVALAAYAGGDRGGRAAVIGRMLLASALAAAFERCRLEPAVEPLLSPALAG